MPKVWKINMFWLFKTDPGTYSWDSLIKDGETIWDGVRNFQARNYLAKIKQGDLILIYHSQKDKSVVGIAKASSNSIPDPTDVGSQWVAVKIVPIITLPRKVTLQEIKSSEDFENFPLVRQSRLSVMPVEKQIFQKICELGGVDFTSLIAE